MRVHAVLSDAKLTAVHVVTTAEEMPVLEAIESIQRVRTELGLPLGQLIVNRCLEMPPETIRPALDLLTRLAPDAPMLSSARHALGWLEIQERCQASLERATGVVALRMPRLLADKLTLVELGTLARRWESHIA